MSESVREILFNRRQSLGLTQVDVAKNVNCTPTHICDIEGGRRSIVPGETLEAICGLYNIKYIELCHLSLDEKLCKIAEKKKAQNDRHK
jgi:transcriptional regulator with XRE-family HTH domain